MMLVRAISVLGAHMTCRYAQKGMHGGFGSIPCALRRPWVISAVSEGDSSYDLPGAAAAGQVSEPSREEVDTLDKAGEVAVAGQRIAQARTKDKW